MRDQNIQGILTPSAFKAGIICTLLCCLVYFFTSSPKPEIFTAFDTRLMDIMFHLRGTEDSSGSVVIVDIDEKSLQEYGQWPWPRDLVATLTEKVIESKPLALGFDLMFAERDRSSPAVFLKQHLPYAKTYQALASSMKLPGLNEILSIIPDYDEKFGKILQDPKIIQGYRFLFKEDFLKDKVSSPHIKHDLTRVPASIPIKEIQLIAAYRPILNIPEIRGGGAEGFLNLFHDDFGTVRKAPLFLLMDDAPYPSMVMEMFQTAHPAESATLLLESQKRGKYFPVQGVSLGDTLYKTDDYGQLNINFRGPSNTFLYLSASDVLNGSESSFLQGKHVLIGSTASGMIDLVATPFSSRMPGVEVHANILDNLIAYDTLTWDDDLEYWLTYALILIGGIAITGALVYLHPVVGLSLSLGIFFILAAGNYSLCFLQHSLIGFSYIFAALVVIFIIVALCNYFFEGKKRLFIKRAFSHYVSPAVVGELMKNPEKLNLQVDNREVSVLFCDIRSFTTLAENTSPAELSLFLNNYFALLTDIIIKHNGMVDKYIGDAIMAVWGTPLEDPQHASNAVRAALEMATAVRKHRDELLLAGQPVRIGIGINSGIVSAGNFGCSRRFDYTVLGDNVNLASRIEGLTRYYPVNILITQFTRGNLQLSSTCRFVDRVQVKGRINPVDLFEPLNSSDPKIVGEEEYSQYLEAIEYYRTGDFKQAARLFNRLFTSHSDPLYRMYNERCLNLLDNPPAEKWTGIFPHN
ncbi:MAG: adenylate cyclase [Desulforhopalus sp.]|jgi:adenylate cyclase